MQLGDNTLTIGQYSLVLFINTNTSAMNPNFRREYVVFSTVVVCRWFLGKSEVGAYLFDVSVTCVWQSVPSAGILSSVPSM
jgi:hypothetical protein